MFHHHLTLIIEDLHLILSTIEQDRLDNTHIQAKTYITLNLPHIDQSTILDRIGIISIDHLGDLILIMTIDTIHTTTRTTHILRSCTDHMDKELVGTTENLNTIIINESP